MIHGAYGLGYWGYEFWEILGYPKTWDLWGDLRSNSAETWTKECGIICGWTTKKVGWTDEVCRYNERDFTNENWCIYIYFYGMVKEQIILCPKRKWRKEPIINFVWGKTCKPIHLWGLPLFKPMYYGCNGESHQQIQGTQASTPTMIGYVRRDWILVVLVLTTTNVRTIGYWV